MLRGSTTFHRVAANNKDNDHRVMLGFHFSKTSNKVSKNLCYFSTLTQWSLRPTLNVLITQENIDSKEEQINAVRIHMIFACVLLTLFYTMMDDATRSTCEAILPVGISLQEGEPPPAPDTFEEGYRLPHHYEKPLQTLHRHSLDDHLMFYEIPHIYTWNDVPTSASVTALAHAYEKPFVADEAIQLMKCSRSQAWPRVEYVVDKKPLSEWCLSRGALMVADGKTIAVVHPHSTHNASQETVKKLLVAAVIKGYDGTRDDVELHSFARELSAKEITCQWTRKGLLSSHMGTEAHYQAELMFNGLPFRHWEAESRVLIDFAQNHLVPKGIVTHATEKEIVCVDADVAGSIDAIVYDPVAHLYHIVDHKRTDKLKKDLRGYGKMKAPLTHLDDCKGAAYALQLSLYQYILERDYGLSIGERVLLSLHPDQPFTTSVPYLKAEVEYIMQTRFALVRARRKVAEEDLRFRCSLTGAPAVDAVFLYESGNVAMEKAAVIKSRPFTPAHELRTEFEARVKEVLEVVEIVRGDCVSWRKRMSENGIPPFS
jgi:hypothetical protein